MIVFLVGYRATGKTTVGRALAARLGCEFRDTDALVEAGLGTTIADCFARHGEVYFRDRESSALRELTGAATPAGLVVSTGGGIVLRDENVRLMRSLGSVVWLAATPSTIRRRLQGDPSTRGSRPGLSGASPIDEVDTVLAERESIYRNASDLRVDVDNATPEAIVEEIAERIAETRSADAGNWLEPDTEASESSS